MAFDRFIIKPQVLEVSPGEPPSVLLSEDNNLRTKAGEWAGGSLQLDGIPRPNRASNTAEEEKQFEEALAQFITGISDKPELRGVSEEQIRHWILNATGVGDISAATEAPLRNALADQEFLLTSRADDAVNRVYYEPGKGLCYSSNLPGILRTNEQLTGNIDANDQRFNCQITIDAVARFDEGQPPSDIEARFDLLTTSPSDEDVRKKLFSKLPSINAATEFKQLEKPLPLEPEIIMVALDMDDTAVQEGELSPELLTVALYCDAMDIPNPYFTNRLIHSSQIAIELNGMGEGRIHSVTSFDDELKKHGKKPIIYTPMGKNYLEDFLRIAEEDLEDTYSPEKSLMPKGVRLSKQELYRLEPEENKRLTEAKEGFRKRWALEIAKEAKAPTEKEQHFLTAANDLRKEKNLNPNTKISILLADNDRQICRDTPRKFNNPELSVKTTVVLPPNAKAQPCFEVLSKFVGLDFYAKRLLLTGEFKFGLEEKEKEKAALLNLSLMRYLLQANLSQQENELLVKRIAIFNRVIYPTLNETQKASWNTCHATWLLKTSLIQPADLRNKELGKAVIQVATYGHVEHYYKYKYPAASENAKRTLNYFVDRFVGEPERSQCFYTAANPNNNHEGWWSRFKNKWRSLPTWKKITSAVLILGGGALAASGVFTPLGVAAISAGAGVAGLVGVAHAVDIGTETFPAGKLENLVYPPPPSATRTPSPRSTPTSSPVTRSPNTTNPPSPTTQTKVTESLRTPLLSAATAAQKLKAELEEEGVFAPTGEAVAQEIKQHTVSQPKQKVPKTKAETVIAQPKSATNGNTFFSHPDPMDAYTKLLTRKQKEQKSIPRPPTPGKSKNSTSE